MSAKQKKTIHFVSLGCSKNRVDTEVMLGVAEKSGYAHVEAAEDADVIVVNTCGFIGEAKQESIDTILELSELRSQGSCKKLVVAGCLSQRYPADLASGMHEVDHFLGSSDMLRLEEALKGGERMLVGNPADWLATASDPRTLSQSRASAYLKIAEGCNRTCAFCTIPEFRGKQRSRSAEDVVREAEALVAAGVREINIISQDTVSYGRDLPKDERTPLAEMVRRVADVAGVKWVRLFYLYPEKLDDELLDLYANHPRVVPYIDMPLQHAATSMLKRMRRGHGQDRQRRVVETLRTRVPNATLRTAFIVGHPGETEEEFGELVDFVKWGRFDRLAVFRYSDEESARSFALEDKVPERVASGRYRKLMTLQRKISRERNATLVDRELEVLVEGPSEEHDFVVQGRHAGQAPEIDGHVFLSGGEAHAGEFRRVRISQASDYDLVGELIDTNDPREKQARGKKRVQLPVLSSGAGARGATSYR